ncbi:hypothetical protein [Caulobacter sp. 602-1]|jgi:hypothetical protein|uniref:hypothetical protein n=1 Tax=Caulobacter sp. 602-1 TaxID=2492472 RepID=UPI000F63B02E|nr:hypothetical protein [Caulobacter sp. 602-1]RRN64646.1 hypothetical protein EIK80_11465 [Caulobacter sp. 602-1]
MAKAFPTYVATNPTPPAKTSTSSNDRISVGQTIAVTAGQLTLGALLGGIMIPKGAEIVGCQLSSTDIDTGGSPAVVLAVGDAGDDDRLITGATIGQAGGHTAAIAPLTGFGYQYTADTLVQVKVTTAPATAAAGTIKVLIDYVTN